VPLVYGVCRTASAPTLSHGGSRLNASKPETNPKTRCPNNHSFLFLTEQKSTQSNRHSNNRRLCLPRRRQVSDKITSTPHQQSKKSTTTIRPSPNERTCMGWHERYALVVRPGLEGHFTSRGAKPNGLKNMLRDFDPFLLLL
jgi:hypothetical protein